MVAGPPFQAGLPPYHDGINQPRRPAFTLNVTRMRADKSSCPFHHLPAPPQDRDRAARVEAERDRLVALLRQHGIPH